MKAERAARDRATTPIRVGENDSSSGCHDTTAAPFRAEKTMIAELRQKLSALRSGEDRGVSPVIGVILMVAITVILAAVIGAFALGFGGDRGSNAAPTTSVGVSGELGYDISATNDWQSQDIIIENKQGNELVHNELSVVARENGTNIGSVEGENLDERAGSESTLGAGDTIQFDDTRNADALVQILNNEGTAVTETIEIELIHDLSGSVWE